MRFCRRIGHVLAGVCLWPPVLLAQTPVIPSRPPPLPASPTAQAEPGAHVPAPWRQLLVAGKFEPALAAAAGMPPTESYIRGMAAERRGAYDQAEQHYREGMEVDPTGEVALALADLLTRTGRRAEALPIWHGVLKAGQVQRSGAAISRAARAAHRLGQARMANAYFQTAANLTPDDPEVHTRWGDLWLEKSEQAEARASYETALKADATYVPALVGMARALGDSNPTAAEAAARHALAIDPAQPDAWLLLASEAMDASKRDEARTAIDTVLQENPRHVDALSLAGALAQIEDRSEDVAQFTGRALAVRPGSGDIARVIGERVARQYRFDEAVRFLREAVALEPGNSRAQASLGLHLLRIGDEAAARKALETAFAADAFDIVTYNLLDMLDTLDGFVTIPAQNLTVRLDPLDAPVLQPYLVPLAEQALSSLSARYGFVPEGPILLEVFPKHDDFAVRTMGLPGMLGALGACFGRVVTMDSPRARPPGSFNWAATLWHELAHVITLQMSGNRLPRWLSEGISTYEEARAQPGWGGESELLFAQAYASKRLIPLADLNSGFARLETINLAYHQASVVVAYLVETHGEAALVRFIRSFGEGLDEEAALTKAYSRSWTTLQPEFDAYVARRYAAVAPALSDVSAQPPPRGADAAAWVAFAEAHAGNFGVQMAAAAPLLRLGELDAARRLLERAATLVPFATGEDSPWRLLVTVALEQQRPDDARRFMQEVLARDPTGAQPIRQLLALARDASDDVQRQKAAERLIEIDPFDAAAHSTLGELALARGDLTMALRELQTAVDAGPPNPAEALTSLAEATLKTGERDAAKQHLIRALEATPRYERAQDLLLQVIESGPTGGAGRP